MTTATQQPDPAAVARTTDQPTPMMLLQHAIDNDVDVNKLEQLMGLQERWERSEAAKRFADALTAFQSECPVIRKTREASFGSSGGYCFASLDDIMRQIQPLLSKHGLAVAFSAHVADSGSLIAECRVRCGVHVETTTITLPVPAEMRVNATQKMGAAFSYAKRYALCAALNITVTEEDTDAGGLAETVTDEQADALSRIADECPKGTAKRCLAWVGVASFGDIPLSKHNEVRDMLCKKRDQYQAKQ